MEELYAEGVATHGGPESCVDVPRGRGEALTGVRAGRAIEPRNEAIGVPTLYKRRKATSLTALALHLLQSALVHVNTLLVQTVLETPEFHDRMGEDERRGLSPLFWTHVN